MRDILIRNHKIGVTNREDLEHLPGHILFDLARNESASKEYRKAAVELLLEGGHRQAQDPELRELRLQIQEERAARKEVQAVVEAAVEELPESGPFQASVTTKTLFDN